MTTKITSLDAHGSFKLSEKNGQMRNGWLRGLEFPPKEVESKLGIPQKNEVIACSFKPTFRSEPSKESRPH